MSRPLFLLLFCLFVLPPALHAQDPLVLSSSSLLPEEAAVSARYPWRFHAGDDPDWALKTFNDSAWPVVRSILRPETPQATDWLGIGWFRLTFTVDPSLAGQQLGLKLLQYGAAEVYLDGQLIHSFGTVSQDPLVEARTWDRDVKALPALGSGPHLLAVRFSNTQSKTYLQVLDEIGFVLWLGPVDGMVAKARKNLGFRRFFQMFFVGLFLAFALLHAVMHVTSPNNRENLYYAVLIFSITLITFFDHQQFLFPNADYFVKYHQIRSVALMVAAFAGLRFIYSVFYPSLPRLFLVALTLGIALGTWAVMDVFFKPVLLTIFTVLLLLEQLRVVGLSLYESKFGARMIGFGFFTLLFGFAYPILTDMGYLERIQLTAFIPYVMVGGLFCFASMHLVSRFARTGARLRHQLFKAKAEARQMLQKEEHQRHEQVEKKLFEAIQSRKQQEAENIRGFQGSLLPKNLPDLPGLEVAAYLHNAPEAGSDFFDFHVAEDGTLTLVLGDAGHYGIVAGAILGAIKSLFHTLGPSENLRHTFEQMIRSVHHIAPRSHHESLLLMKIRNGAVRLVKHSMPPPLLYRAHSEKIDAISYDASDTTGNASFQEIALALQPGDTLLLNTDGFSQRFNDRGETMSQERAQQFFGLTASAEPDDIIDYLLDQTEQWANRTPPRDDMTFIVIRRTDEKSVDAKREAKPSKPFMATMPAPTTDTDR